MIERKPVEVVDVLLDTHNFRHNPTASQPEARAAIIQEQGQKLVSLAKDVATNGFSPFDLPLLYPSGGRRDEYVMLEGNRRLLVLKALLDPELMRGTPLHKRFLDLHAQVGRKMDSTLFCAIVPDRKTALMWAGRKHQRGLGGAGTEDWNTIANDRYDAEMGLPTPSLNAMDFVRNNAELQREVAAKIDSSQFNLTTLGRLIGDDTVKEKLGLSFEDGELRSVADRQWLTRVLAEIVTVIATGKFDGDKFNVRSIDDAVARERFADKLLERFPKPAKSVKAWRIDKDAATSESKAEARSPRKSISKSSSQRDTLIPKDYRLKLPQGKVNDIFHDLRSINIGKHPNAVAVEMRVFVELSVKAFMNEFGLSVPSEAGTAETLKNRITECIKHITTMKLMTPDDLAAINRELGNKLSFVAPNTLHQYVHSATFSANPEELKITWNRLAPFMTSLWSWHS